MSFASSPALSVITNSWVGTLLASDDKLSIGLASAVAGAYFLFGVGALINFLRFRLGHYLLIIFFCAVRVVAFSIRAYMQKHLTTNLAIVYEVFFAFGFVLLCKMLCLLLTAWNQPIGVPVQRGYASFGLLRSQNTLQDRVISIFLMCAQILIIVGATDMYTGDATLREYNKGLALLKAGYLIFLICIGIYDVSVFTAGALNRVTYGRPTSLRSATLVLFSLEVLGLLLTTKAVFQVIAIFVNPSLTFRPKLFYPLEVAPELFILAFLSVPGYIRHVLRGSHGMNPAGRLDREKASKAEAAETPLEGSDLEAPAAASPAAASPISATL